MSSRVLRMIAAMLMLSTVLGCGVKGDPLPPRESAPVKKKKTTP